MPFLPLSGLQVPDAPHAAEAPVACANRRRPLCRLPATRIGVTASRQTEECCRVTWLAGALAFGGFMQTGLMALVPTPLTVTVLPLAFWSELLPTRH